MSRIVSPVCSAASATTRALSEIERAVTANSSIVADVSATAADCSFAAAAASRDDARNSFATSAEHAGRRAQPLEQRVAVAQARHGLLEIALPRR